MKDARGNDIPLDGKYTDKAIRSGMVFFLSNFVCLSLYLSYPVPFECSITPRSITTKRLIQETVLKDASPSPKK